MSLLMKAVPVWAVVLFGCCAGAACCLLHGAPAQAAASHGWKVYTRNIYYGQAGDGSQDNWDDVEADRQGGEPFAVYDNGSKAVVFYKLPK